MDVRYNPSSSSAPPQHSIAAVPPPRPRADLTNCVSIMVDNNANVDSYSVSSPEDDGVIAAPAAVVNTTMEEDSKRRPAEIPPDTKPTAVDVEEDDDELANATAPSRTTEDEEDSDWGDDESYEYEDDDDVAFSGFLAPTAAVHPASNGNSRGRSDYEYKAPVRIVEEEVVVAAASASETLASSSDATKSKSANHDDNKRKWKEPSQAAVSMSLRAQSEKTGGKRRLAQDLYRIMNQDTEDAGFSLQPKSEDQMDKWTIKLFQFDEDSNLAKDMMVVNTDHIELEMRFPDQYPFEPPFVRVVRPRFKRQTGFVMNGALCMELLTKEGWNPINDIESVIVSVRSLLVVGDGRLQAASDLSDGRYQALLKAAGGKVSEEEPGAAAAAAPIEGAAPLAKRARKGDARPKDAPIHPVAKEQVGSYSSSEAQAAYSHLSDYHKKKGWDTSGWWARKG